MSGPVSEALVHDPALAARYAVFRGAAHAALDPELAALIRLAVERVHGLPIAESDAERLANAAGNDRLCIAYAERIPFEHTAITDAEAAEVRNALGEPGFVAFSVAAALADAECRAARIGLAELAR